MATIETGRRVPRGVALAMADAGRVQILAHQSIAD
jgi:hypothetical protein